MIDWSHSAHSFETALALAKASQAAYRKNSTPAQWAAAQGFAVKGEFEQSNMFGFAAAQGDTLVVAFRGTDQLEDWGVNGNMDRKQIDGLPGTVHDGFWNQGLQPLLPAVLAVLNGDTYRKIWITGHSLGGAIAVCLQSCLIFQHNRMVTGTYTFGQPRVGDAGFRDGLDAHTTGQYHRYVNHNDVVPLVPPYTFGYRHGGAPVRFHRDGKAERHDGLLSRLHDQFEEQLDVLLSGRPSRNIAELLKDLRDKPTEGIREHAIEEYIGLIEKNV